MRWISKENKKHSKRCADFGGLFWFWFFGFVVVILDGSPSGQLTYTAVLSQITF